MLEGDDIIQLGDRWWNVIYPFIDYPTGDSIDGMISFAQYLPSSSSVLRLAINDGDTLRT
jgi:hypothetical protein